MENNSDKKIKICHLATVDITARFIIFNFLKFLKKHNYQVYMACSFSKWKDSMEKEGIITKNIKMTRRITPVADLISFLKMFFYFKKEKFDIVHTYTPKAGILGRIAARLAGVPVVIHTSYGFYVGVKIPWLHRKLIMFGEKVASLFCDLVFSQNKEDIEMAIKEKIVSPEKIKFSNYGIDINRFNQNNFSQEFILQKKKELGIEGKKVIGMVGRFVEEKGYLDLFEAFKIVKEKMPEVRLFIVAPKDKEKKDALDISVIEDYGIEKETVVLGHEKEITNIEEAYCLMDIFVLPSYREGFPYSIMEASSFGKPIIATNIRGCREAVENNVTGMLFEAGDSKKLAEEILYLLENTKVAYEMGKNGREKAEKQFDEKDIFGKIKEEYITILEKKTKKPVQVFLKRVIDLLLSSVSLVILSPLFLLVAILVKLDSRGPVFFMQERIGKDGKSFYPYKFRTMIEGAVNKGLGVTVSKDDERITKIGKFLRKLGIDELPQLINVFKGEMSIVGPRPTLRYQVEKYNDFERKRLLVKPGLAGWALIHGRNSLTWEERIKYDVWYVENWSLWLDFVIMFKTVYLILIKQEGVYGKGGVNDPFKR